MESSVAALVLLSALLHAGWNALLKLRGDPLVVIALIAGTASGLSLAGLPFLPLPVSAAWPYLAGSMFLHTAYNLLLVRAYQHGDLGQIYPIARGTAPLIATLLALTLAGEIPSRATTAGIVLIAAGVMSLAFRGGRPVRENPHPVLYALAASVFIASYTVADGLGARVAGDPHSYTLWLFVLDGIPISAIAFWRRRGLALASARRDWKPGFIGGAMSLGAYWLIIWALTLGPMAPVAALRETGVIFAALFGALFLKEGLGRWRITATTIVAAGSVLLRLG